MILTEKTLSVTQFFPVLVNVAGHSVRCVEASRDFLLSIDDGPPVTFGPGRSITLQDANGNPMSFSKLTISILTGAAATGISLIIGSAEYRDDRVVIANAQSVRTSVASAITHTEFALPSGAPEGLPTGGAGQFMVTVRNMDPVNAVRLSTNGISGLYLGPGELADLPTSAAVLALGTAGQILGVTVYTY